MDRLRRHPGRRRYQDGLHYRRLCSHGGGHEIQGLIEEIPLNGFVSAVSVGIVENEKLLDLCYAEDSKAMVDMNVVMTDRGEYIEIQGTGEDRPFSREELNELLLLAAEGCGQLHQIQKQITGEIQTI